MKARRFILAVWTLVLSAFLLTLGAPVATQASEAGRRNTAIGLGAVTLYELFHGRPGTAIITGAGTAYAYKRYRDTQRPRYYRHYNNRYHYNYGRGSLYNHYRYHR